MRQEYTKKDYERVLSMELTESALIEKKMQEDRFLSELFALRFRVFEHFFDAFRRFVEFVCRLLFGNFFQNYPRRKTADRKPGDGQHDEKRDRKRSGYGKEQAVEIRHIYSLLVLIYRQICKTGV